MGKELAVPERTVLVLDEQRLLDTVQLGHDIWVVQRLSEQTSDDVVSFGNATLLKEPTGRVGQEEQANHDDNGEE